MRHKLPVFCLCLLTSVLIITAFSGCGPSETVRAEGEPEYAPVIADDLMQAFNKGDYETYSKDFDTAMKRAVSETVFEQMRATVMEKIGNYKSREFTGVEKDGVYTVVLYNAKFSKEPADVILKFVFLESGENTLVSGLWFDSPRLRDN